MRTKDIWYPSISRVEFADPGLNTKPERGIHFATPAIASAKAEVRPISSSAKEPTPQAAKTSPASSSPAGMAY